MHPSRAPEPGTGERLHLQARANVQAGDDADASAAVGGELQRTAAERHGIGRDDGVIAGAGLHPDAGDGAGDPDAPARRHSEAERIADRRGDVADRDGAVEIGANREGEVIAVVAVDGLSLAGCRGNEQQGGCNEKGAEARLKRTSNGHLCLPFGLSPRPPGPELMRLAGSREPVEG